MSNQAPANIVVAPYEVYYAAVGTAFPAFNATPSGSWKLLGTSGKLDQTDGGVTIAQNQSIDTIRGQGTAIRKAVRTEEGATISVEIMDTTLESEALSLGLDPATDIATVAPATGVPGTKAINFDRGPDIKYVALLIRGHSPYSTNASAFKQYEFPKVFQNGSAQPVYSKTGPATLAFEFVQVAGPAATSTNQDLGRCISYSADALP